MQTVAKRPNPAVNLLQVKTPSSIFNLLKMTFGFQLSHSHNTQSVGVHYIRISCGNFTFLLIHWNACKNTTVTILY